MLKLVFYAKEIRLKVRLAFPDECLQKSCHWKDKLEYTVTDDGDFTMVWTSLLPDLEPLYAEALIDLVSARYPVSKDYPKLSQECSPIVFKDSSDEWVFYGGSFNPWHHGHQSCLNLLPPEKICLILPDRNPQKEFRDLNPVSTLLQLSTLAKINKHQFLVPTFLIQEKKNPTIEWIERVRGFFPQKKLSLLLGFDSFKNIKTWIRPKDLLCELHAIYIVSRLENEKEREMAVQFARSQNPKLEVIFLGKHDYEYLSSTELRNKKGD